MPTDAAAAGRPDPEKLSPGAFDTLATSRTTPLRGHRSITFEEPPRTIALIAPAEPQFEQHHRNMPALARHNRAPKPHRRRSRATPLHHSSWLTEAGQKKPTSRGRGYATQRHRGWEELRTKAGSPTRHHTCGSQDTESTHRA